MFVVSCTAPRRPDTTTPQTTSDTRQTRFIPRTSPNMPNMPSVTPQTYNRRNTRNPITDNRYRRGNMGTSPMGGNWQDKAEKIADAAARQKEIESATCVITGNTALVGVQFDEQYKGELTDAIKKKVEERCMNADSTIRNVVVTADPDIVSRIEEMWRDIRGGKPISGFTSEINELLNRIKPDFKTK